MPTVEAMRPRVETAQESMKPATTERAAIRDWFGDATNEEPQTLEEADAELLEHQLRIAAYEVETGHKV